MVSSSGKPLKLLEKRHILLLYPKKGLGCSLKGDCVKILNVVGMMECIGMVYGLIERSCPIEIFCWGGFKKGCFRKVFCFGL
jgi:hypothetical protein